MRPHARGYKLKRDFGVLLAEGYTKSYSDYLCETYLGINLDEELSDRYDYPDVTDRVLYTDGTLKGGKYKGLRVMVSRKDNPKAPRTQTVFRNGKPALIHINSKQAINPAFSWYHEIAHVEEPGGQSHNPAEAEFVADRHAIRKLGMTREQYKQWLMQRDSSGDSPAHIAARTKLCNNFSRYI